MNIPLERQYAYLNWRRRVAQLHRQMLLEAKQASINHVHSYIIAGYDPRNTPEISAEYYSLVDEYGESLFQSEIFSYFGDATLIKEEDKDPDNSLSSN